MLTQVHVEANMAGNVSHALMLFGGLGSGGFGPMLRAHSTVLFNNGTPDFELDLQTSDFGDGFAMVGLTGEGSGFLSLVVSTPGLTYMFGMSFEQAFPGFSEAQLINQLLTNDPAADVFLRTNFDLLRQIDGTDATCVSFSNGADFGTITMEVTSIPAPAVVALLPLGLLLPRRRR